jgi:hypothetical protein
VRLCAGVNLIDLLGDTPVDGQGSAGLGGGGGGGVGGVKDDDDWGDFEGSGPAGQLQFLWVGMRGYVCVCVCVCVCGVRNGISPLSIPPSLPPSLLHSSLHLSSLLYSPGPLTHARSPARPPAPAPAPARPRALSLFLRAHALPSLIPVTASNPGMDWLGEEVDASKTAAPQPQPPASQPPAPAALTADSEKAQTPTIVSTEVEDEVMLVWVCAAEGSGRCGVLTIAQKHIHTTAGTGLAEGGILAGVDRRYHWGFEWAGARGRARG